MTLCPGPGLQNNLARLWLRREPPAASAETWRSLDDEGLYATRGWLGDSTPMMVGASEGAGREAGRVRAGKKEERAEVLLRASALYVFVVTIIRVGLDYAQTAQRSRSEWLM